MTKANKTWLDAARVGKNMQKYQIVVYLPPTPNTLHLTRLVKKQFILSGSVLIHTISMSLKKSSKWKCHHSQSNQQSNLGKSTWYVQSTGNSPSNISFQDGDVLISSRPGATQNTVASWQHKRKSNLLFFHLFQGWPAFCGLDTW